MTRIALLYMYESWRVPRQMVDGDRIRNVVFALRGRAFAGMSWRAPR